jgi:acyl-homoserine lactone synthase
VITILSPHEIGEFPDLMDRVYRLRHDVFVTGLGWTDIAKPDGRDIDEFDHLATHVILMEEDEILGYMRLLPSIGPHLLANVLSDLCEGEIPRGDHIWEFSRLFILKQKAGIPRVFVSAMKDWAREQGVSHFTAEVNLSLVPVLQRYGWKCHPLGSPKELEGIPSVAILMEV